MAGITYYERMRRQYGEGAILMVHHFYNKYSGCFFRSDLTTETMDEFLTALAEGFKGGASNYVPVRTYYVPLKEYPREWERAQYYHAQSDEPQKDKFI